MALDLGSAQASITLDANDFIKNAQQAGDAMQNLQSRTESISSGGFLNWVNQNEAALNRWGKGMLAVGGIITGAFAAPIIAGSRAAWGQVDAVEQATVAMRAYSDSTEEVDRVLASLIAYARSDMGVLFQRQDLFEAAQSMVMYGAAIEDVDGYVQILSRSVGLGLSNWDDLNRVIGRVGSTGRLTGNDFDYLRAAGFDLDDSLRNTNMTWEELMMHLDEGIPADALAGQADTIRGKTIRLQSALRGLGLAFLGVDSETSKFIEGGLGWQMMRGMERLTDLMKRAAPAVQGFGNVIAAIARPIGTLFDLLLRLPQPVQTAMLMFTAATGVALTFGGALLMLSPQIAGAIIAFQKFGGMAGIIGGVTKAVGALRVAMLGLFANPVILAGAIAIGALFAAYKTNFMGFGDAVDTALGKLGSFTDALDVLLGKPSTKNFDIITTADNVWDEWQLQDDGSYKHAELGITSKADDGSLQYMGYDEETGKWVVLHINAEGEEIPGWVESSSQDPGDPTKFFMEIELEGGEKITAVYDEVEGTYQILESPAEFNIDADKAIEDMGQLEKAARLVRGIFILVNARISEFSDALSVLATKFRPVLDFAQKAYDFFDPFRGVIERVTGTFETLNSILLGDWGSISWESVMDAVGMGTVYDAVVLLADGYERLKGAWDDWTNRDSGDADTGMDPHEGQPVQFPDGEFQGFAPPNLGLSGGMGGTSAGGGMGSVLRDAATAAGELNRSLIMLNPSLGISKDSIDGVSHAIPMYTGATRDAESATGAMASGMGSSFGSMAASALTSFTSMRSTASSESLSMQGAVGGSVSGMASTVGLRMDAMALNAGLKMRGMANTTNTQTSNMNSFASSNASTMASTVGSRIGDMASTAGTNFGDMATEASTSGSQMSTGMTGWMLGAHAAMIMRLGMMVSTVRDTGSTGYDAGHYAGSMISRGFANGMLSYLGIIRGAANQMVAAAAQAVIAKAMISSPSRLFEGYGKFIGEGLEVGILGKIGDVGRAADRLIDTSMPSPALNTPIGRGYGGQVVHQTVVHNHNNYVTPPEMVKLIDGSDKGSQAYAHLSDPDAHNYGGGD